MNVLHFLVGSQLANNLGANKPADRIASGAAFAMTGGTPVGLVLARQLALNRAAPPSPAPPPKDGRLSAIPQGTPAMDDIDKAIQKWIESYVPADGEKLTREQIRTHLLAALEAIAARLRLMTLEEGLDPEGTDALKSMLAAILPTTPPRASAPPAQETKAAGGKG